MAGQSCTLAKQIMVVLLQALPGAQTCRELPAHKKHMEIFSQDSLTSLTEVPGILEPWLDLWTAAGHAKAASIYA